MISSLPVTASDIDTAAKTLWGECRGEPLLGQQGVAWVIRNRATWQPPQWWGHTVGGVCLQPFQFSCWNKTDPQHYAMRSLSDIELAHYVEIIRSVMAGEITDPTNGATHYERVGTGAGWAIGRSISALIGNHAFYAIGPRA